MVLYAKPLNNNIGTTKLGDWIPVGVVAVFDGLFLLYPYTRMLVDKDDIDDRTTFVLSGLTTACFIHTEVDSGSGTDQTDQTNRTDRKDGTNIVCQR